MRKVKHLLVAAVVAASTLVAGAPQLSATETTPVVESMVVLEDGLYWILDGNGDIAGYAIVEGGYVTQMRMFGPMRYA